MFGLFSLPKLIFTAAIIAAVWYGFKWLGQRQKIQKRAERENLRAGSKRTEGPVVEDMVQCPDCGAYVPDDGRHKCG